MTPAPKHPLRCETCMNEKCEFHQNKPPIDYMSSPVSFIVWKFTSDKGCASHSSAGNDAEVLKGFESWLDDRCLPYSDRRVEYYDLKSKLIELHQKKERPERGERR